MNAVCNKFCLRQLGLSMNACRALAFVVVASWVGVNTVSAAESAPFAIDTSAADIPGGEVLSSTFVIDTTAADVPSGGVLSSAFVIDTTALDWDGLAVLSAYFTIDMRENSEKLPYKYSLWANANTPVGQRGMDDGFESFGISNLLAFALGWEAGDPSTWYSARVTDVVKDGGLPGVWLRAQRRNDLPELIWTWKQSDDLQDFTMESLLLDSTTLGLGGIMEQWDVRVALPSAVESNFYRLNLYYENNE